MLPQQNQNQHNDPLLYIMHVTLHEIRIYKAMTNNTDKYDPLRSEPNVIKCE